MKTKILADFQICISVPLTLNTIVVNVVFNMFRVNIILSDVVKGVLLSQLLTRNILNVAFCIETSRLICSANQITVFYMKRNIGLK